MTEYGDNIIVDNNGDLQKITISGGVKESPNLSKKFHAMTDNQKKLVFEYCGWEQKYEGNFFPIGTLHIFHPLDGNNMVEAIKKIQEKGDMDSFDTFVFKKEIRMKIDIAGFKYSQFIPMVFGNPENFFSLMGEWLEVGK
jgi:hypothetical protein